MRATRSRLTPAFPGSSFGLGIPGTTPDLTLEVDRGAPGSVPSGYPPYLPVPSPGTTPPLTQAQIQDVVAACVRATQTGEAAPLGTPFTYSGPAVPGMQPGDEVTHMVPTNRLETGTGNPVCITNAEARRQCKANSRHSFCDKLPFEFPTWAYVAVGGAALALLYYVVK